MSTTLKVSFLESESLILSTERQTRRLFGFALANDELKAADQLSSEELHRIEVYGDTLLKPTLRNEIRKLLLANATLSLFSRLSDTGFLITSF